MRTQGLVVVVFASLIAGCGGAPPPASTDGGDDGGAVDLGFATAPHERLPQVTTHTTPVFTTPQLVTITFDGYPFKDTVERLGDFYAGSSWLAAVGAEYGVTSVTHAAKVSLGPAPATLTEAALVTQLKAAMGGMLPAPSATNAQLVYMVYVPRTTKFTDSVNSEMCTDNYLGYHSHDMANGVTFAFAVIGDCNADVADVTSTASHELIETATDPDDAVYIDAPDSDPWSGMYATEVADLCEDLPNPNISEGGFALQRSWSNRAAMGSGSPCVPVPANDVYRNVTPSPATVPTVRAGSSTTITLTGWSTAPSAPWDLYTSVEPNSDFDPMIDLSAASIGNGTTVTATLHVPAGTMAGKYATVLVYSDGGTYWPLTIVAE